MAFNIRPFGLALLSALLLAASWYFHLGLLIFIAWVPLLILEDQYRLVRHQAKQKLRFIALVYFTFLIWNLLVTWWVVYASFGGACMAFICNSLLMTMVFVFFSNVKNRLQKPWAIYLLIPIWLAWEHGHTLWDLSWTWLSLGNVFAFHSQWVQWYEYTGTSGGGLWILGVNLLMVQCLKQHGVSWALLKASWKIALVIVLPIALSKVMFAKASTSTNTKAYEVVVVQPNIDPYNVKFQMDYQTQFLNVLQLVKPQLSAQTDYLILPETFITDNINEATLAQSDPIVWFRDSLIRYFPKLHIITGANTYKFYETKEAASSTARKEAESGLYYDQFNTAIQINKAGVEVYHKSKLVPGVERMPFPWLLKPLESLAINMGGTMGSLGTQAQRGVFKHQDSAMVAAPVVCYESVYGDYLTNYVRAGANFICIITNDGWWEDTPGYIQHLNYARLRAIENRMPVVRCANTGISCFINADGSIEQSTHWWQTALIKKNIRAGYTKTFYSTFGDWIAYISVGATVALLFLNVWLKRVRKVK